MRFPSIGDIRAGLHARRNRRHDPESIINDVLREMKEAQIRNRERAVQTITVANYFENVLAGMPGDLERLEAEIAAAHESGDRHRLRDLAYSHRFLTKRLEEARTGVEAARAEAERAKQEIRDEEMRFRVATARALALKALIRLEEAEQELGPLREAVRGEYGAWGSTARCSRYAILIHVQVRLFSEYHVPISRARPGGRFVDDLGLDAERAVALAVATGREFGVELSDEQAHSVTTVEELASLVHSLLPASEVVGGSDYA